MVLASFRLIFIVCISLILFPLTVFAGEPVEALEKKLNTIAGKQRIEVLNKLAGAYRKKSPGKCITFANEALELSVRFDDLDGKARALSCLSYGYLYSNNEEAASKHIRETKSLYKRSGDEQELADFLYAVGRIYQQKLNKRVQALEFLLEARNLYEKNGHKLKTAISANALGAVYWDINRYDKATYFYFQALKRFKEIGNRETNTATTLNNIGMVYHKMGNYEKALEYYREALQIRQKQGLKGPIGGSLNNIGILHFNLQKYHNALEYFRKATAWLRNHPRVSPDRIALVGGSKGAEAALLLASVYPDYRAVVAWVPAAHVWQGISMRPEPASSCRTQQRQASKKSGSDSVFLISEIQATLSTQTG